MVMFFSELKGPSFSGSLAYVTGRRDRKMLLCTAVGRCRKQKSVGLADALTS
jgi:hypothetical protein